MLQYCALIAIVKLITGSVISLDAFFLFLLRILKIDYFILFYGYFACMSVYTHVYPYATCIRGTCRRWNQYLIL